MSSKLRLLHHPASQPCRSARQFLIENNIPFEDEVIDLTTNINERQEFSAAADEMFGQRLDAFQEVNGTRQWWTYPVDLDVLDKYRYVVEVSDNKIVSLTKVSKGDSKIDIPRRLILKQKVQGKRPKECQAELGLGPPLLTVRSKMTKRLVQLFDAKIFDIPGDPQYCLLRYDDQDRCEDLEFQEAEASTKKDPLSNRKQIGRQESLRV